MLLRSISATINYDMDADNFTPLPEALRNELSDSKKAHSHHFKIPDIMLLSSFLIFVLSVGYWVQSTVLQPGTKATQKIIEATMTPILSPTLPLEENLEEAPIETSGEEVPVEESPTESELAE